MTRHGNDTSHVFLPFEEQALSLLTPARPFTASTLVRRSVAA